MLRVKNQKTTTITPLIPANNKKEHILLPCTCARQQISY